MLVVCPCSRAELCSVPLFGVWSRLGFLCCFVGWNGQAMILWPQQQLLENKNARSKSSKEAVQAGQINNPGPPFLQLVTHVNEEAIYSLKIK